MKKKDKEEIEYMYEKEITYICPVRGKVTEKKLIKVLKPISPIDAIETIDPESIEYSEIKIKKKPTKE